MKDRKISNRRYYYPMTIPGPTYNLPLFASPINAGPPFPADSTIDQSIDLNEFLIKNPTAPPSSSG
jgi:SOS-response transcriptional repressor LexA